MTIVSNRFLPNRQASTGAKRPFPPDAYDYVISSRADLAAIVTPVGGVFELPSGSYAVTAVVVLDTDEQVFVPAGNRVYIQGMTPGDGLTVESSNPLLSVEGTATLVGLSVENTGDGAAVENAGTVNASRCDLTTASASAQTLILTSGTWHGWLNEITGPAFRAVIHTAGDWFETGSVFDSATTTIDNRDTAGLMRLTGCSVYAGQNSMRVRGARIELIDCLLSVGIDNAGCIAVLGAPELQIIGGRMITPIPGTDRAGVYFISGVTPTEDAQIIGVTFDQVDIGVRYVNAGSPRVVTVSQCVFESSVTVGINWVANFPTSGLLIVGNALLGATPFNGFTAATPGVNIKACSGAAGLLTETAIVP